MAQLKKLGRGYKQATLREKIIFNYAIGKFNFATENQVIAAAIEIMEARATYTSHSFKEAYTAKTFIQLKLADREREVFCVLFLDSQNCLIKTEEIFWGTIDRTAVYPREIVKAALRHNAAAVILAHNHPSGMLEPSDADKIITERLVKALGLLDIRVLDHIIASTSGTYSFAERGLI